MTSRARRVLYVALISTAVALLCAAFLACAWHFRFEDTKGWVFPEGPDEVCGVYWGEDEIAYYMFSLRPDKTYSQCVTIKQSRDTALSVGRWRLDVPGRGVWFDNGFMLVDELRLKGEAGPPELNPKYATPVERLVFRPMRYRDSGLFLELWNHHTCWKLD